MFLFSVSSVLTTDSVKILSKGNFLQPKNILHSSVFMAMENLGPVNNEIWLQIREPENYADKYNLLLSA